MKYGVEWQGLVKGLDRYEATVRRVATDAMARVGFQFWNDMVMEEPVVPLKTGDLRGSATLLLDGNLVNTGAMPGASGGGSPVNSAPELKAPRRMRVTIAFNRPQAAYLHEKGKPEWNWSEPGSGPKWIAVKIERHGNEYMDYFCAQTGFRRST